MTAFWVIGFFILLIALLLTRRSCHQYRLDGEDEKQRNNVLKLELAIYEHLHQYGHLPKNNHQLRRVMPKNDPALQPILDEYQELVYSNPYEQELQAFVDSAPGTFPITAGLICFEYHPANDKTHEVILIRAYGRHGQILLETWVPSFHGVTSATG